MRPYRRGRDARLDAVAARMTVRQRVAALLAEPESPAVRDIIGRGLTPAGWAAVRRTCDRVDQLRATTRECLARLASAIAALYALAHQRSTESQTATLADRLEFLLDWRYGRRGPEGALDPLFDREVRAVADALRGMAVPVEAGGDGDSPVPTMEELLRDGIRDAHHLLRALTIEAEAFAAELGSDPLTPELRALSDRQRTDLTACIETIDLDPPVALTEPSDAYVAAIAARCRPEEEEDTDSW